MLASRTDADDVMQDAYLRWQSAERGDVASPEAYLTRIVTRLCLDRLKSARAQREIYVGPWLPEPVLDAEALSPESEAELASDLSFALLLALDRLSPAERAAFLLHDVFSAPFSEISDALERSEAACRQLAARARRAVREARRPPPPNEQHQRLLLAFAQAAASGDLSAIKALLKDDVVMLSDGGGRKLAALNPIRGADRTARFFIGALRKARRPADITARIAAINGAPGMLVYFGGDLEQAQLIAAEDGLIAAIYVVRNPDKLAALRHAA